MQDTEQPPSTDAAPNTETLEGRIQGQFNEEKWTRITAKDVSISRFKILEQILDEATSAGKLDYLKAESKTHMDEYEASIASRYFLGMIALGQNFHDDMVYLRQLLEQFQETSKWAVVDYLSEKMLSGTSADPNRTILRARATALEKLGKHKEAVPILEKLARQDRKNPDIALKYADAIINEDLEKAITFYKQAAESFAKNLQFEKLKTVWNKLIDLIPEDFNFFRKVERILSGHRQKEIIAELYVNVANYYIKKEDNDKIISLSKKILEYNPNYVRFKNELIKAYKEKYKDHSLLEPFIKFSGLLDQRKSLQSSILNFETNIVFDKENYVFHRSWGVGKIKDLTTDFMVVDFKEKKEHKMDIQMALKSLKPLREEHFWVHQFEKAEDLKKLFQTNIVAFFKILLSSFGGKVSLSDIKAEIADIYIPLSQWSKWWSKIRPELLKDSLIGISSQKKDIIELYESPVTNSEGAIEKFQSAVSFEERLPVLLDTLKQPLENEEAIEFMIPYFRDNLKVLDPETKLRSLLALDMATEGLEPEEPFFTAQQSADVMKSVSALSTNDLAEIGMSVKQSDLKRQFIKWVKKNREDWKRIYLEMLFETPVKLHKTLITDLVSVSAQEEINEFFARLKKEAKDHAEVYLWTVKNLLSGGMKLSGLVVDEVLLGLFRLLKTIQKIEPKGTKLKTAARDLFFGTGKEELITTITSEAKNSVRKFAALFRDVPYFTDAEKNQVIAFLREINPQVFAEADEAESAGAVKEMSLLEKIEKSGETVASAGAIEAMKEKLEHILKVEMPQNSEEIGLAQEKGDLRENAEYKAALEKQAILQATVTQLENDIKQVQQLSSDEIETDIVGIGTRVKLNDIDSGDTFIYSIMDQWDADVDKGIISYKSPLGKALLNLRKGNVAEFGKGDKIQKLEIQSIEKAINAKGFLI